MRMNTSFGSILAPVQYGVLFEIPPRLKYITPLLSNGMVAVYTHVLGNFTIY